MRRLATVVLAILLAGCAAQPSGPPPLAATGQPAAQLYLFNVSGWTLIPGNQEVEDNGVRIASLPRLTYATVAVVPGRHVLKLHGRTLSLTVEQGRTYYVALGYRPDRSWALPIAGDPVFIREISEAEARGLLAELKPA